LGAFRHDRLKPVLQQQARRLLHRTAIAVPNRIAVDGHGNRTATRTPTASGCPEHHADGSGCNRLSKLLSPARAPSAATRGERSHPGRSSPDLDFDARLILNWGHAAFPEAKLFGKHEVDVHARRLVLHDAVVVAPRHHAPDGNGGMLRQFLGRPDCRRTETTRAEGMLLVSPKPHFHHTFLTPGSSPRYIDPSERFFTTTATCS
jgi:hypothetical protein